MFQTSHVHLIHLHHRRDAKSSSLIIQQHQLIGSPSGHHPMMASPNVVIKAKSIPVSPKTVASSTGVMREKWLHSIYKEIENFLQNMAIDDADPALVVAWKQKGKWPLPCQMVFVLKPLTQSQQEGNDVHEEYKHKSRLVICGNFATWRGEHSTNHDQLGCSTIAIDAQSSMFQGDYMVECGYHECFPQCRYP